MSDFTGYKANKIKVEKYNKIASLLSINSASTSLIGGRVDYK